MQYLIFFIILCFSAFAQEKVVLQLKWEHQFQFAGYYAALEKGYYKEHGIEVQILEQNLSHPIEITEELLRGSADYAVGSSSLLMDIANEKEIMLLAAIFEHSPLVLVCSESSNIRNPKHLRGKRIMLSKDEGHSLLFSRMLEQENVNYTSVPQNFEAFIRGDADAYSAYLGNEPYHLTQKEYPYTIIDPANYGLDGYSDFLYTSQKEYKNHPKRVGNFIQASIKGWRYALSHREEIAALIHSKYNPSKSLDALLFEAEMIRRHAILDEKNIGRIELDKLSHMTLLMQEGKGMDKEIDIESYLHPRQRLEISLTREERDWIDTHPVINYSSVSWFSTEVASSQKEITKAYMELISLKSGLEINYLQKEPHSYALAELERGRIDLFMGVTEGKNNLKSVDLQKYPLVIVTRNDAEYISLTQSLQIKTIALIKGSLSAQYIEEHYPQIKKVYVKDIKEALDLVSSSQVYATTEILPLVSLHIKKFKMANLKISGEFPYQYTLKANIRSDYPLLKSITDKAILAISEDEHETVNQTWNSIPFVQEEDMKSMLTAALVAGLLIFILVYSNWRLRQEMGKRASAESELKHMLDVVNQNVLLSMTDREGNITFASDAFCRLTGYKRSQLLGTNHRVLKSPKVSDEFYEGLWEKISSGNIWKGELENVTKTGRKYWVEASITPIFDDSGEISNYMAIRKNITDKKQMEKLAITDALSTLFNRRYFNMVFEKEINRLKREAGVLGFMMLDIDHFKLYNDKYGHLKGDEVIIAVSECLKEVCQRATDQIFRLGGEEFGILLLGMKDEQIHAFANRVIKSIENLNIVHEENTPYSWVTASLGAVVCEFNLHTALDARDVYQIADDAMYTAKQMGRNRAFVSKA